MAIEERDAQSGYMTTGHEWNGIKELNTPVPRVVYFFLIIAAAFSVVYWILMPAWPVGTTYTKGLLGIDQRKSVAATLKQAALDQSVWMQRIDKESFEQIQNDPALMQIVRGTGHRLFGDNCAACHGADGRGGYGFPNLTTVSWLWGGAPEALAETIRVGINSANPNTRVSQMPAFGKDKILPRADIDKIVDYVRTLSNPAASKEISGDQIQAGQKLFVTNCGSCHGDDGRGKTDAGAPNLTDKFWIYGGDPQSIFTTVWGGRQGHMPTWQGRLSPVERKILALYLYDQRSASQ